LDEFKDPPLMFQTLRRVHDRLGGKFEFHYIGTSDPERYSEFALARSFTLFHGFRTAREVAEIMKRCHAGILTSWFEGMPCYLLELLAVGRPIVAVTLPQYELVVEQGKNGFLVERDSDTERLVDALSDRLIETWSAIRNGTMTAHTIREHVIPYSVDVQLHQHFARHSQLAAGRAA
jgi:glycosyltransferase involved in cell wall biosynthesis